MELNIKWSAPLCLHEDEENNSIYYIDEVDELPDAPAIYIFARRYGDNIEPLYVGKAISIKNRVRQQLNNVKLMKGIENSKSGQKLLFVGHFEAKSGQDAEKAISIIENATIEHCLSQGYDLFNLQGTKRPVHNISFSGNREISSITGKLIKTKKAR